MIRRIASAITVALLLAPGAYAQIAQAPEDAFRKYGETVSVKYRVGASIESTRGAVRDVLAIVAVPWECDEQEVIVLEEDVSPEVESVDYRFVNDGARQMVITIPHLPNGTEAHAILTFEVRTKTILPPDEFLAAQLVPPKKPDRDLKRYLGRSPYIQHNHGKIRRTLKEIFDPKPAPGVETDAVELTTYDDDTASQTPVDELSAWQRVEKIYDFVQNHVEYLEGEDQSAVETLERKKGDCHDISALFVALCRADKIPARMVWVHEHQYPEFCLADGEGKLHWFPCESSGMRAFGEMPTARVIMQKGDNFRTPERRESLRYASDYLIGLPVGNAGKPKAKFIREML